MRSIGGDDRLRGPVHEIRPVATVHMDVDIAGPYQSTSGVYDLGILWQLGLALRAQRRDPTATAHDHAILQKSIRQD